MSGSPALPSGPVLATASTQADGGGFFNTVLRFAASVAIPQHGRYAVRLSFAGGTCQLVNGPTTDQYVGGGAWVNDNGGGWQPLSQVTGVFDIPITTLVGQTTGLQLFANYISNHVSATLTDGRILVVGSDPSASNKGVLYDPNSGTLTPTSGSISVVRSSATATTLPSSGRVLIVGGQVFNPTCCTSSAVSSIDLFDPAGGGTFAHLADLPFGRFGHTATLLTDGNVLIAGGWTTDNGGNSSFYTTLQSAYVINPSNGAVLATLNMTGGRTRHTATLLGDGTVLFAGGWWGPPQPTASAELFDPNNTAQSPYGSFVAILNPMRVWRSEHTATLLTTGTHAGQVLLAGGGGPHYPALESLSEFYDPTSHTFADGPALIAPRHFHTASLLSDGRVVLLGGNGDWENGSTTLASAEAFVPSGVNDGTFSSLGDLLVDRQQHTTDVLTAGPNAGKLFVMGGWSVSQLSSRTAEVFDPSVTQLVIGRATLPSGVSGQAYPGTVLTATGGTPGFTWGIAWGQIAPGLTLNSDGHIIGSPSVSGVFSFVVQVTDSAAVPHVARESFVIDVDPLFITTGNLGMATVNVPYSLQFQSSGGDANTKHWVVDSTGGMPPGLTLSASGLLSGTPTTTGNLPVNVRVSDDSGHSVMRGLTLPVEGTPTAHDDSYSTPQNQPLSIGAPGVLANDTDPAFQMLTAQLVVGPSHGSLTLNGNGSFTYTAANGFVGELTRSPTRRSTLWPRARRRR